MAETNNRVHSNIKKHRVGDFRSQAVARAKASSGQKVTDNAKPSDEEIQNIDQPQEVVSDKNTNKSKTDKPKKANIGGHYVSDEKLKGLTVRFTESAYDTIKELAEMNEKSMADIVRLCVDECLVEYLRSVVFVNRAQGRDLQDGFFTLTRELEDIRYEINKIGVNYNQEVRMLHAQYNAGKRNLAPVFKRKAYDPILVKLLMANERIGKTIGRIMGTGGKK